MSMILLKLRTEWWEYFTYAFQHSVCHFEQTVSNFKMLFAPLIVQTNVGFLLTVQSCVGRVCLTDLNKNTEIQNCFQLIIFFLKLPYLCSLFVSSIFRCYTALFAATASLNAALAVAAAVFYATCSTAYTVLINSNPDRQIHFF